METINKKGPIDRAYVCGFQGNKIGLYARSLFEAKQRAVEHFRPKKKEIHLIWVELAEEEAHV